MRRGLARQRLVALFFAAAFLFNYPLLSLFDRSEQVFGLPVLFVYIFGAWASVIALIAWTVGRRKG
ncbi:MAG TPA: hypothetical protein PLN31_16845 [Azoarcus taiwanensis]|uniref:DUF3311 domain-containing protein n=1 Tax=Azoarcus taiwanensis TaxID=666964 RepID=A0A972FAH7_9RHOO|nr:hypothetical protein [Azoarcus taiwanensis]NMG03134.1 hypothetical protein [Azoarcus taiwanensis]HRQ59085.1 hypothetical protein [Azoarcus taiwanensis]